MEDLERLVRELGLENRLFLLKTLRAEPFSVSELRQELKNRGSKKPFSTVGRYIESLQGLKLVVEKEGSYTLSLKGCLVLSYIEEMEEKLQSLRNVEDVLCSHPIEYLPERFLRGASVLGKAEVVSEPFQVVFDSMKAVENAGEIRVLNKGVMSKEFLQLALRRCLEKPKGLRVMAVVDEASIPQRREMLREVVEGLGSGNFPKERFQLKILEEVPMNLLVADDKGAGLSLPDRDDRTTLTPAFKSQDKEFVAWARGIFDWYWKRGEPADW